MILRNDLETLFQQHKDKKFLLVMPGGNHGDHLIYFGLHQLAQQLNIDYDEVDERQLAQISLYSYEVIYLHGGGGYNEWSSGAVEKALLRLLDKRPRLVIQGPCTVSEGDSYLQGFFDRLHQMSDKQLIFYSRENTTYALASKFSGYAGFDSRLNFDTALFTTKADIERSFGSCRQSYRLYAIREDSEKPLKAKVHDYGPGITLDPAYYCRSFAHWVKVHAHAREIITTRTHSAVIGAILGKKTILYPNSYHKNRSIWEYSLRDMGVLWGPDTEDRPERSRTLQQWLPGKLRSSYKVRQAILWANKVPLL